MDQLAEFRGEDGKWLGKYENVYEALKGGKHAMSKLGEKMPSAPEEYKFSFDGVEGLDGFTFNPEDPMAQTFLPIMKEANIPQEVADKFVQAYAKQQVATMAVRDQEFQKLGDNPDQVIGQIGASFEKMLTPEEAAVARGMVTTADEAKVFLKYIEASQRDIDISTQPGMSLGKSFQDYYDEAAEYKASINDKRRPWTQEEKQKYDDLLTMGAKLKTGGR